MNETAAIVQCAACGAKNKIPQDRLGTAARCGKCHVPLPDGAGSEPPPTVYTIRCSACRARNRVPQHRIDAGARCGKCGTPLPTRELFIPQPVMVTDANFETMVMKSPLPVLLFCWAPWCPTCGAVTPIVDEFARDSKGRIRVGKLNVDTSPMTASAYNVLSVPTLFIFDNGRLMEQIAGGLPKHDLMMKMAPYLG
jgi:thioredoxin 2